MKYIKCILLLLSFNSLNAQITVELPKMNILYPSVENPLSIAFETVPDSNLLLIPSRGTITRTSSGQYIWQICKRDTQIIFLSIFDRKADILLEKPAFRLKKIPEPKIYAALSKDGYYGRCTGLPGIALVMADFDFDIKATVLGFNVTCISKDKDTEIKWIKGYKYNREVLAWIEGAEPNDIFIFDNFQYTLPCDSQIHYHSGAHVYKVE